MNCTRRQWICRGSAMALGASKSFALQVNFAKALDEGPEVERFRNAERRALTTFRVAAESRFVTLRKPALRVHILAAGKGSPVVLIHGGGVAVQFAPVLNALDGHFECFAADRPGSGLTDGFDYTNIPVRQLAIDFIGSLLDALDLPKAALIGNSMGGLWELLFALTAPERVAKLVLLGGPAASGPPPYPRRLPRAPEGDASLDATRARYRVLMADVDRAPKEILEADFAATKLPGASRAWNTMVEEVVRERITTYSLRPELKNLQPPTLFIYGDKDIEGPPSLAREMAAMAPRARCEIVPDAGHLPWLDQPDVCATLIRGFLRSG